MNMSLRTDRSLLRALARSTRYLHVSLTAPVAPARADRLPLHVGIVLDRSGSMDGERKFALATEAVAQSLRLLAPQDRFTLVVYDTRVDVLMPSSFATAAAKETAMQRLAEIGPHGGTDLYGGWMTAGAQMVEHLSDACVNRVLLLTDGLANAGITDHAALVTAAAELRRKGIATTTFGVGDDFDERLLRDIARESGGQSYFIETPAQIADLLTSELGEALEVVRRHVSVRVALPPGAEGELLHRYRHVETRTGDRAIDIHVGDMTSGQELTLAVRLTFPKDRDGATTTAHVSVTDAETPTPVLTGALAWTYADHAANDVQPRNVIVDRAVAAVYAARARAEATEANRHGDLRAARTVLESTARRIHAYANHDGELDALWRGLLADVEKYSREEMSSRERKEAFYAAEGATRNRDSVGRSRPR